MLNAIDRSATTNHEFLRRVRSKGVGRFRALGTHESDNIVVYRQALKAYFVHLRTRAFSVFQILEAHIPPSVHLADGDFAIVI